MIFESHAHYDDEAFDTDREELLSSLPENEIEYVIDVGASIESTKAAIALAQQYPFIYAAAGVHPSETAELNEEKYKWLQLQCGHPKVIAVGEIGLDYHWQEPSKEIQKNWFKRQLILAKETELPVIIHSRDAARDTMDIIKAAYTDFQHAQELPGVIHCYSYSKETAREYLDMGYMFGIGGVITFANAKKLQEAAAYIPLENILLETDSPYLAPMPHRGQRNSSLNLPYIAEKIAEIKGCSYEEVVETTSRNAKRLFLERDKRAE